MDAMEAILTRRSIRRFEKDPIPDEIIEKILKAAMYAPSAGNQQPWHFVVIRDRETLDKIPSVHKHALMAKEAQAAILVCGDAKLDKHDGMWVQDCSAATQNLLLAAHALGLGGVWCGVYPRGPIIEGLRELLDLPDHVYPFALIPLGYPKERKGDPGRFDKSRIHLDRW